MAQDHWGREIGYDLSREEMARQMNSPVKKVSGDSPIDEQSAKKEDTLDKLYAAVNEMAMKADANAARDLEQAKAWAETLNDFTRTFKKNDSKSRASESDQTRFLDEIANSTKALLNASGSNGEFWVSISRISNEAQKDIAEAIRTAGCCGATKETMSKGAQQAVSSSIADTRNVASALKTGTPSSPLIVESTSTVINQGASNGGGGGGSGGGGSGGLGGSSFGGGKDDGLNLSEANKLASKWFAISTALQLAGGTLERIHRNMISSQVLDIDPVQKIFSGGITASNKFRESVRAIVHQTQGFGDVNRQIEEQFRGITEHALASGVERARYQQIYLQNLERGLPTASKEDKLAAKNLKISQQENALLKSRTERMQGIQTSALATAKALHMNADSMNDLFLDWHMHLKMSEMDLGEMGRHMQNVARNSGVTGAQLEIAMKNADGIVKNLNKAGIASVGAVKNVTEFMASAQKHGFEEAGEFLNSLMTRQAFLESKQKLFLINAAVAADDSAAALQDVSQGTTITRPGGLKNFESGMENLVKNLFANHKRSLASVGVDVETMDLTNLGEVIQKLQAGDFGARQSAMALQNVFRNLGVEVGVASQMIATAREQSLTPVERIASTKNKLKEMSESGLANTDEFKRLQRQQLEAQTNMSLDAFGRLNKFAVQISEAGGAIDGKLSKEISVEMTDVFGSELAASDWLKDLQGNAQSTVQLASERAKEAGLDLTKMLEKRGVAGGPKELEKLLTSGNILGMRALQESLQEVAKEEQANNDPITDIRNTLISINHRLGGWLDEVGFGIGTVAANVLYIGGFIGSILFEILAALAMVKGASVLARSMGLIGEGGMLAGAGGAVRGGTARVGTLAAGTMGATAAGLAAAAMLVLGGMKGFSEGKAEEAQGKDAKFTRGEGLIYGMLTGGAGTGSSLSKILGIQKDSVADKTLGGVGSTAWGASIGAAIGVALAPFTAGISIPTAAFIGGLIGAATHLFKILTEGSMVVQRYVVEPFGRLIGMIQDVLSGVGQIIAGIFTLDINKITSGLETIIYSVFSNFVKNWTSLFEMTARLFANMPYMLGTAIKAVIVDIPRSIMNAAMNLMRSLASNEYVGEIFKPFLELWEVLADISNTFYDAVATILDAFSGLSGVIWNAISPLFETAGITVSLGGMLKSAIKTVAWGIGMFIRAILFIPTTIAKTVKGIVDFFKYLFDVLIGHSIIPDLVHGIIEFFAMLPLRIMKALFNLGVEVIKGLPNALASIATFALSALKSVFLDFPTWLYNSMVQGLEGLGSWLYNSTVGAATAKVDEFIKEKTVGVNQTTSQQAKHISENGTSYVHGYSGIFGGMKELGKGNVVNGLGKIAVGGAENVLATAEMLSPVGSLKSAMMMAKMANKKPETSAALAGAFSNDQAREAIDTNTSTNMKSLEPTIGLSGGLYGKQAGDALKSSITNKETKLSDITATYEGAFKKDESQSALESATSTETNRLMSSITHTSSSVQALSDALIPKTGKGSSSYQAMGLFSDKQAEEAQDGSTSSIVNRMYGNAATDLNGIVTTAIENNRRNSSKTEKNIVAEVSRVLDYEQTASDIANQVIENKFTRNGMSGGDVSTNMLDYSDQMRGEVDTLGLSRATIESSVAQEKYGQQVDGSTAMLSMDMIAEYLTVMQASKLDEMIDLLMDIKKNTSSKNSSGLSSIIGAATDGLFPPTRPGVKSIARDMIRGKWDLSYGDYSANAIDGRGGQQ